MKRNEARIPLAGLTVRATSGLGPFPASAVRALAELGLSDHEIARYSATPPTDITRLRLCVPPERQIGWTPADPSPNGQRAHPAPGHWPVRQPPR